MPAARAGCWRAAACLVAVSALLGWPGDVPAASGGGRSASARGHDSGVAGCRKGRPGRLCRHRRRARRFRPADAVAPPPAGAPAPPPPEVLDTAPCEHADVPADAANIEAVAAATRCLLDAARRNAGLPVLRPDPALAVAADGHAGDMVERGYFAHDTPEGTSGLERAAAAGYEATRYGETIAAGAASAATARNVVDAWLSSAPHREALLGALYRDTGIGVAAGTPGGASGGTWVVDLADR